MTPIEELSWVGMLAGRCNNDAFAQQPDASSHYQHLQLAANAVKKLQLDQRVDSRLHHLAVLGPTQSGKSSLVNVLLDTKAASASPLAGFTVHSQGYADQIDTVDIAYVGSLMAPLQRTGATELDSSNLASYVFEKVTAGSASLVAKTAVWDTPDFDSISASGYEHSVIKTLALADIVVLVASKDKYGDKRVWDMLELINALKKPLLVFINKTDDKDEMTVTQAFSTRYMARFSTPLPHLICLPFIKNAGARLPISEQDQQRIQAGIERLSLDVDSSHYRSDVEQFIEEYEDQWLEPLAQQADAQDKWTQWIREALDEAETYYAINYLENPDKYDTFNRALMTLLGLLEIPGIAPAMARARTVITWPARQLLGLGRGAVRSATNSNKAGTDDPAEQESLVHEHMLHMILTRLQGQLLQAPATSWWQSVDRAFRSEVPTINQNYANASKLARVQFEPEIDKAANLLHEQLKTQPALLNTLRAARASADAAGVALAVKTGGLSPTDLIVAPVMLSLTTMLTESALGQYLTSVKNELKQRQKKHIRQRLLQDVLEHGLIDLVKRMPATHIVMDNLEPELQARLDAYQSRRSTD